ncbi:MAG: hypothetical protein AAGA93_26970 [Actinomycetota bacterium]
MSTRIEVLVPVTGVDFSWRPGDIVELDDDLAERWADGVRARKAPKDATPTAPAPQATSPNRREAAGDEDSDGEPTGSEPSGPVGVDALPATTGDEPVSGEDALLASLVAGHPGSEVTLVAVGALVPDGGEVAYRVDDELRLTTFAVRDGAYHTDPAPKQGEDRPFDTAESYTGNVDDILALVDGNPARAALAHAAEQATAKPRPTLVEPLGQLLTTEE